MMPSLSMTMPRISVTCPGCRVSQLVEQSAVVAVCSGCTKRIRCIDCGTCGYYFGALEQKKLQCPRCLSDIGPWKGKDIPFAALAGQRQGDAAPVDGGVATTDGTEVNQLPKSRSGLRWAVVLGVVLAAGVGGLAYLLEATTPKAVTCPLVKATSTLTFAANRSADGNYHVTATGTTVNESTRSLHDVVVTWEVTYADGSIGTTTATLLPKQGSIAPGATSRWSGAAAANDGPVKPTGIKVLHNYTTAGRPSCLT
jgi:hypothetical protein